MYSAGGGTKRFEEDCTSSHHESTQRMTKRTKVCEVTHLSSNNSCDLNSSVDVKTDVQITKISIAETTISLNANEMHHIGQSVNCSHPKQCADVDPKPSHDSVIGSSEQCNIAPSSPVQRAIRAAVQTIDNFARDDATTPPRESVDTNDIFNTPPARKPSSTCPSVQRVQSLSPEMSALIESFNRM